MHLDNRIQTQRVQLPVRRSDEWSGARMAQAGAIHAFHCPCLGRQGATRLRGHNATSSRPLIDWRGALRCMLVRGGRRHGRSYDADEPSAARGVSAKFSSAPGGMTNRQKTSLSGRQAAYIPFGKIRSACFSVSLRFSVHLDYNACARHPMHHDRFTLSVLLQSIGLGYKAAGLTALGRKCSWHHAGSERRQP